jgi:hypothetical protein
MVQTYRTQRGHLETLYPWDNLEQDASNRVIPNLEADAVDELANQDQEAEEVLPTTLNVIFWRALLLLKLQGCQRGQKGFEMVLQSVRMQGIICCKVNTSYTLEKVHELIAETSNPKSPSIREGGPSTSKSLNNECLHPE